MSDKKYPSANQAFKNFLEETGQADLPKAERNSLFKQWLDKVNATGELGGLLDMSKITFNEKLEEKFGSGNINKPTASQAKEFRPLGLHPIAFVGVTLAIGALLTYGIVVAIDKFGKSK